MNTENQPRRELVRCACGHCSTASETICASPIPRNIEDCKRTPLFAALITPSSSLRVQGIWHEAGGEDNRLFDTPQFETRPAGLGRWVSGTECSALCPSLWRRTSANRLQASRLFREGGSVESEKKPSFIILTGQSESPGGCEGHALTAKQGPARPTT